MKPLVSVIVPVYNVEDYVLKCLKSISSQSYDLLEIIVVDDGSTDKSGKICDEFAKTDKRVKVFHKKNSGLSGARNYGIKRATGRYICLVDSDDYIVKDFVKKMIETAMRDDAEIVVCGYNNEKPEAEAITGKEATIRLLLKQENMEIIAWNKMYKVDLFAGISYPEGANYEDNLTTYKLLSKAKKVEYVAVSLYRYIERVGSITKDNKKELKLLAREKAANEAMDYFEKDTELLKAAEISLLTAKFAWIDFAISKQVDWSYFDRNVAWVKDNKSRLLKNRYLGKKLKLYIEMVTKWGGKLYIVFRRIRHE